MAAPVTHPDPQAAAFHQDEVDAAWLYGSLAELEADPRLAEVYRRLSHTEAEHARQLGPAGARAPSPRSRGGWDPTSCCPR
jgi:hypothetical protein